MAETPDSEQSKREAQILDAHLPDGYTAAPEAVTYPTEPVEDTTVSPPHSDDQPEQSSLLLPGGDLHRDLFRKAVGPKPRRSNTFSASATASPSLLPADVRTVAEQREPGGFRRQFVQQHRLDRRISHKSDPVTKNFISFLELYGSFAGEDLVDTDDDDDSESAVDDEDNERRGERRPLLGRKKSSKRIKREGDAGSTKTFFTLLKAFVGTGIMFLPKAFRNGGILFSSITLITVSIVTTICFRLLLHCRRKYGGGGYGELGDIISGRKMRAVVLSSITLSQLGFVCAGLIFTAENWLAFANAVAPNPTKQPFKTNALIAIQFIPLIPLSFIRNISKLGPAALLADVFIMVGLIYIWQYDIKSLSSRGMDPTVTLFNASSFPLTIGNCIFTFEGIGLILPIQSSMKHPEKFNYLLYTVMFIVTAIFTSVGVLCYATFGEETKVEIISNFPQSSKLVNVIQFLYAFAVMVGEPVQLFPAIRIIETSFFGERATGKKSKKIKWKKNALRTFLMILCGAIAIVGASDLDKFVSLIGAFACVPLVYIYPPYLHYKGVADTTRKKAFDIALMCLGVVAMAYSSVLTVYKWIST